MVDYDRIISEQAARLEDAGFSSKAARGNALKMLKLVKKRDKGKVRVPHPTLPKTWLLVSPEKAKRMTNAKQ